MPQKFIIPTPKPGPYSLGPDSQRQPGVPQGVVTKYEWRSTIFPGTVRHYWIYVPVQYTPAQPANVMVFQDGGGYASENGDTRVPIVFDNLIHQGRLPVTIGIFVDSGHFPAVAAGKEPVSNRSFEYDTLSDQYARFLLEEILPAVQTGAGLAAQVPVEFVHSQSRGSVRMRSEKCSAMSGVLPIFAAAMFIPRWSAKRRRNRSGSTFRPVPMIWIAIGGTGPWQI